jgi:hypothetical protein
MKDSRFIELLNLYVDREITPGEAAELEAEVERSAARRKVFNQYCRLDRACTIVLARQQTVPTPRLAEALAEADGTVTELPVSSGGRGRFVLLGGMLAAAAAIAVVFYQRGATPAPGANSTPTSPTVQVAKVPTSPVSTGREATVALPFGDRSGPTVATVRPAFAWMKHMELSAMSPLSDEDLLLAGRADKSFSSRLNWGLHRDSGFARGGSTRPPTELNAFEVGK